MTRKINYTTIPTDYVRFYPMDWNWIDSAWNANATITNWTFTSSSFSYISDQLDWWASTTFTYSSATYTNSYLIKNWQVIKNSWEVSSTALSWVSWNSYQWLFLFNKTLSSEEEAQIEAYAKRRLWPTYWQTRRSQNNDFPKYSLPNLENWKVLEISKPASWWVYYDQTGNWNNSTTITNVTDSTNGLYNVMSFNWTDSKIITNNTLNTNVLTIISTFNTSDNSTPTNWSFIIWVWQKSTSNTFSKNIIINNWIIKVYDTEQNVSLWEIISSTNTYNDWKNHRVGCVFNWTSCDLYIDWVLIWSWTSNWQNVNLWETNIGTFLLWNWSYGQYFDWDVISPVICNYALSDQEMQQDYYSNKTI